MRVNLELSRRRLARRPSARVSARWKLSTEQREPSPVVGKPKASEERVRVD
jgi:hypothetical protein